MGISGPNSLLNYLAYEVGVVYIDGEEYFLNLKERLSFGGHGLELSLLG